MAPPSFLSLAHARDSWTPAVGPCRAGGGDLSACRSHLGNRSIDRRLRPRGDHGLAAFACELVRATEPDTLRSPEDERNLSGNPEVHQGAFPCWSLSRSCKMSLRPGDAATVDQPKAGEVVDRLFEQADRDKVGGAGCVPVAVRAVCWRR